MATLRKSARFASLIIAIGAVIAAIGPDATAYTSSTCNGKIVGAQNLITFEIDRCFTPAGSAKESVLNHGRDRWNNLTGMLDRFAYVNGDSNCFIDHLNWNGISEIAVVPANDPNLHGAYGMFIGRYNPCESPFGSGKDGRLIEGDLVVSNAFTTSALDPLNADLGAREIAVHELGHALGMGHDDPGTLSVMCNTTAPSAACGKLANRNIHGSSVSRAETRMTDDTKFALTFHASSQPGGKDPAVSPWKIVSNVPTLNVDTTVSRCPGQTFSMPVTLLNNGKINITSSDPALVRTVLSTDTTISSSDTVAAQWSFWAHSGVQGHIIRTTTVPALGPGTYHVGVVVDYTNAIAETDEYNNAVRVNVKVVIPVGC